MAHEPHEVYSILNVALRTHIVYVNSDVGLLYCTLRLNLFPMRVTELLFVLKQVSKIKRSGPHRGLTDDLFGVHKKVGKGKLRMAFTSWRVKA